MVRCEVVDMCPELAHLRGRTVHGFFSEYCSVALRLDRDDIVNFATSEVSVGKWFEVFPIAIAEAPRYEFSWTALFEAFEILEQEHLWREEWLEQAMDSAAFLGSGPHQVHCTGPLGSSPESASKVIKVHAGIKLVSRDGRCVVICSSDNTPFKVDLAAEEQDIERILQEHSCQ